MSISFFEIRNGFAGGKKEIGSSVWKCCVFCTVWEIESDSCCGCDFSCAWDWRFGYGSSFEGSYFFVDI